MWVPTESAFVVKLTSPSVSGFDWPRKPSWSLRQEASSRSGDTSGSPTCASKSASSPEAPLSPSLGRVMAQDGAEFGAPTVTTTESRPVLPALSVTCSRIGCSPSGRVVKSRITPWSSGVASRPMSPTPSSSHQAVSTSESSSQSSSRPWKVMS